MTDIFEQELENIKAVKKSELAELITIQLEMYPYDDTAAWDDLTADEKLAQYSLKFKAEAAVAAANSALTAYKAKKNAFYDTTKAGDMATFDATYAAARDLKRMEWQDKEDYATATGDWTLESYTPTWADEV